MSEHMALENLTVLDLTRVLAGPFCTMMLADMGANVIKIEVPKGGDDTRSYPPFRAKNLNGERESVYFANINRNKKGITLNLKAPEGKEIFKELVHHAGAVVFQDIAFRKRSDGRAGDRSHWERSVGEADRGSGLCLGDL